MERVYEVGWLEESTKFGHIDVGVSGWSYSNLFAFTTQTKVDGEYSEVSCYFLKFFQDEAAVYCAALNGIIAAFCKSYIPDLNLFRLYVVTCLQFSFCTRSDNKVRFIKYRSC